MILDTSFVIDLMRGAKKAVEKLEEFERSGEAIYLTAPTIYELFLGIALSRASDSEKQRVEEVLREQVVLPLDEDAARAAGELQGELMREGVPIDPLDALIAGIAVARGERVATRNVKHFSRVRGVEIVGY